MIIVMTSAKGLTARSPSASTRPDRVFVENLKGGGCDRDADVGAAYQQPTEVV